MTDLQALQQQNADLQRALRQAEDRIKLYTLCMNTGGADQLHARIRELEGKLAAASLRIGLPAGWKAVPPEPTEAMLRAAMDCKDADPGDSDETYFFHSFIAAVAAAPAPR